MTKAVSDDSLLELIPARMACPICHHVYGRVTEGPTRVFVKTIGKGNIRFSCDVGAVCLACIGPFMRRGYMPCPHERKPVGGVMPRMPRRK